MFVKGEKAVDGFEHLSTLDKETLLAFQRKIPSGTMNLLSPNASRQNARAALQRMQSQEDIESAYETV